MYYMYKYMKYVCVCELYANFELGLENTCVITSFSPLPYDYISYSIYPTDILLQNTNTHNYKFLCVLLSSMQFQFRNSIVYPPVMTNSLKMAQSKY